jgi:uncharacterized SAM-binding protein YcdF (DUF218 family)
MGNTSLIVEKTGAFVRLLGWTATALVCAFAIAGCLMKWGGYLLEASNPLPAHADAAVVLEGSLIGERARLAGAMQMLRQNITERVLISVPAESYWGEPVPSMARHFIETRYGNDLAKRVDFCVVSSDVNSTLEEAQAIENCIREHPWQSVVIVTSDYHTRRAGIIWRRSIRKLDPSLQISVHGVKDPAFQARGWWQKRLWAKTWLLESTKLIWTETFGR